jgi:hypothetical protein
LDFTSFATGHVRPFIVFAGLDPAIHAAPPNMRRVSIEHRVKPGGEEATKNADVPTPKE